MLEDYEAISRDTALKIMLWAAVHGDLCGYPTKVGQYALQNYCADYSRYGDVLTERNFELWRKKGWDTVKVEGIIFGEGGASFIWGCGYRLFRRVIRMTRRGRSFSGSIRSAGVGTGRGGRSRG